MLGVIPLVIARKTNRVMFPGQGHTIEFALTLQVSTQMLQPVRSKTRNNEYSIVLIFRQIMLFAHYDASAPSG